MSWKIYFEEKRKFLDSTLGSETSSHIIKIEEGHYTNLKPKIEIFLKNIYSNSEEEEGKNFFKKSKKNLIKGNRYYYKKFLFISYGCLLFNFFCELIFTIFRLLLEEYTQDIGVIANRTSWSS